MYTILHPPHFLSTPLGRFFAVFFQSLYVPSGVGFPGLSPVFPFYVACGTVQRATAWYNNYIVRGALQMNATTKHLHALPFWDHLSDAERIFFAITPIFVPLTEIHTFFIPRRAKISV